MQVVDAYASSPSTLRRLGWVVFAALLLLLIAVAHSSLAWMVTHEWFGAEEYSHAVWIPLLAAYLVRQRADAFESPARGHGFGLAIVAVGCAAVLIGSLSTIHTISQYGFLIGVFGAVAVTFGIDALRRLVLPLLILVFMVPLPNFLYQPLSSQLQLYSSELGVLLIRALGISVLLRGNVIDLGVYQLQVLEACNGLRYLFPLASLGFLFGYLFRGPVWQRVMLLVATVPITIALNSVRIAVIGLTVEHWGVAAAEGVLHQFEGWVVFLVCVMLLLGIARAFASMNGYRGPLLGAFAVALGRAPIEFRQPVVVAPWAVTAAMGLLFSTFALVETHAHGEATVTIARRPFAEFPMNLDDGWIGRSQVLDEEYLEALQLDDYVLADFANAAGSQVNLYSAYYGAQLAGRSAHSPRSCLPGDGWRITDLSIMELTDPVSAKPVPVNRVVMTRGNETELVYYWFEQRGRVLANEYLVKWYLLVDALETQRSDGALVRLITPVPSVGGIAAADATLRDLFARVKHLLPPFVPG